MNRREVLTTAAVLVSAGCLGENGGSGAESTTEGKPTSGTESSSGGATETDTDVGTPTTETGARTTDSGRTETDSTGTETTVRMVRRTTGTGAGVVASQEFTVRGTEGSTENKASVTFESGGSRVVVTGIITGKNGCQTAVLDSVGMDGSTLTVTVATKKDADAGAVCSQALMGIAYRLTVTLDSPLQSVRVVHRGAGGRSEAASVERGD